MHTRFICNSKMIAAALLITGFLIVSLLYWRQEFKRCNRYLEKFPGPPYIPLIGSKLTICGIAEQLPKLLEYFNEYKGSFLVKFGPVRHIVFVTDPKTVEFILSSTKYIDKSLEYKFLSNWLGQGILTSTGNYWRKHRKIITPAFHFSILEGFVEIFDQQAKKLVENLKRELNKPTFDIYPYVSPCSLDIMTETSMGSSVNAQDETSSEYTKALRKMFAIVIERMFSPIKMYDTIYQYTNTYKREKEALNVLHGYTKGVINRRKEQLSGRQLEPVDEDGKKRRFAFLDLLLSKGNDGEQILTDREIQDEVETILFEGHDTTTTAIMYTLYCIANHPEVQQRLIEELEEVYGDDFLRNTTHEDLQKMSYMDKVVKETLRVFPSVPFIGRELPEDVEIAGQLYPKGCTLLIFIYGIHRDPKFYPDPEKFDPERFAESNNRTPYTYVPFSAGSRNCIGQRFAISEIKTVVSRVVREYELLPAVPKHKVVLTLVSLLKSLTGVHVQIKKRNFKSNKD